MKLFKRLTMTQAQVDEWNARYPEGSPCRVRFTTDSPWEETKTRSKAWLIGGNVPVVLVEGKTGGWSFNFIEMVPLQQV